MIALNASALSASDRRDVLQAIRMAVSRGDLRLGDAIRALRCAYLGVKRARFASLVGISERQLAKIENATADPRVGTLNRVLAPFGLQVGLAPVATSASTMEGHTLEPARYDELRDALRTAVEGNRRPRRT